MRGCVSRPDTWSLRVCCLGNRPFAYDVEALYFHNEQIGFALFEIGPTRRRSLHRLNKYT